MKRNGRTVLADVIPLATPFMVQIFPVYACNFSCNYCLHSVPKSQRNFVSGTSLLNFELYKKSIDDLKSFPQKLKMLRFAGTGEPLLHPKISEMVAYARDAEITESLEIVTNGSLLTPEFSDKLINAGLNWLRVSIQGVADEQYKTVSAVEQSVDKLVENLTYFFNNKKNTKVYIKTIDIALSETDREQFNRLFEPISDILAIENLTPATEHIDYTKISSKDLTATQDGVAVSNAEVCSQPFYMMQINPDGYVVPCCAMETATVLGDVSKERLLDIWHGKKLNEFQCLMLKKEKFKNNTCANCENYRYGMFEEDILDNHLENLLLKLDASLLETKV